VLFFFIEILVCHIKEDVLKLVEADVTLFFSVVFRHDLVHLILIDLVPHLVHSSYNIVLGDFARAISIKLVKHSPKHIFVYDLHDVDGSHQELAVVDLSVSEVVYFINDFLNIIIWNVNKTCLNTCFQLFRIDETCSVNIKFNKLLS
jgi:uncharacterized membrane protein